jgi:hypothetical protein
MRTYSITHFQLNLNDSAATFENERPGMTTKKKEIILDDRSTPKLNYYHRHYEQQVEKVIRYSNIGNGRPSQ